MRLFPLSLIIASACACLTIGAVVFLGCGPKTDPSFQQGQEIYKTYCIACHGVNGSGILYRESVLNSSAFVTGDPEAVITAILYGKQGTGLMPGWHMKLTDQEVAAVATYIRQAWSNQADPVTAAMVAKVRTKEEKGRSTKP
jgi:mono/diheme cytochrome c family protein